MPSSIARIYAAEQAVRPGARPTSSQRPRTSSGLSGSDSSTAAGGNLGLFGCLGGIGGWGFGQVFLPGELPGLIRPWTTQNPPLGPGGGASATPRLISTAPGGPRGRNGGIATRRKGDMSVRDWHEVSMIEFNTPSWQNVGPLTQSKPEPSIFSRSHLLANADSDQGFDSGLREPPRSLRGQTRKPGGCPRPQPPSRRRPVGVIREELLWSFGFADDGQFSNEDPLLTSSIGELPEIDGTAQESAWLEEEACADLEVQAQLVQAELEKSHQRSIWGDRQTDQLLDVKNRTVAMRKRTLQLMRRVEQVEAQYQQEHFEALGWPTTHQAYAAVIETADQEEDDDMSVASADGLGDDGELVGQGEDASPSSEGSATQKKKKKSISSQFASTPAVPLGDEEGLAGHGESKGRKGLAAWRKRISQESQESNEYGKEKSWTLSEKVKRGTMQDSLLKPPMAEVHSAPTAPTDSEVSSIASDGEESSSDEVSLVSDESAERDERFSRMDSEHVRRNSLSERLKMVPKKRSVVAVVSGRNQQADQSKNSPASPTDGSSGGDQRGTTPRRSAIKSEAEQQMIKTARAKIDKTDSTEPVQKLQSGRSPRANVRSLTTIMNVRTPAAAMANLLEENKMFEIQRRMQLEKLQGSAYKRQGDKGNNDKPTLCVISIFEHSTSGDLRLQVSLVTVGRTLNMKVQAVHVDELIRHVTDQQLPGRQASEGAKGRRQSGGLGGGRRQSSGSKETHLSPPAKERNDSKTPRIPPLGGKNKWASMANLIEVRRDETERDYYVRVRGWEPPDEKQEVAAQKVNLELLSRFRHTAQTSSQPEYF